MSVQRLDSWRLPGCGDACRPRQHDPATHEQYGYDGAINRTRVVRTGPLVMDLDSGTLTVHGTPVMLSGKEWDVLAYLASHVGRRCFMDDIIASVWGVNTVSRATRLSPDGTRRRVDRCLFRVTWSRLKARIGPAAELVSGSNMGDPDPWRRLEYVEPPV